jgi:hypothetical protein
MDKLSNTRWSITSRCIHTVSYVENVCKYKIITCIMQNKSFLMFFKKLVHIPQPGDGWHFVLYKSWGRGNCLIIRNLCYSMIWYKSNNVLYISWNLILISLAAISLTHYPIILHLIDTPKLVLPSSPYTIQLGVLHFKVNSLYQHIISITPYFTSICEDMASPNKYFFMGRDFCQKSCNFILDWCSYIYVCWCMIPQFCKIR